MQATTLGLHGPVITCHHSKGSFEVQLSVCVCVCVVSCCPVMMMEHDICSREWGGLDPYVATCSNNSNKPFIHPSIHLSIPPPLTANSQMSFCSISALNHFSSSAHPHLPISLSLNPTSFIALTVEYTILAELHLFK